MPASASRYVPKYVSFVALTLEQAQGQPDLAQDITYNRGKSLEDLFSYLAMSNDQLGATPLEPEKAKRARGRRGMRDITVETYTLSTESKESTPLEGAEQSKESTPATVASTSSSEAPDGSIKFVSGNPFVEVTKGLLHMYKENQTTSLEEGVIRGQMICMLGVPAKIKTPDLLQFTSPCHTHLEMMRVIHDSTPNQYMVLFRFRCQEAADEFYHAFNGVKFNSFEDEECSLVYISRVETCKESEYYPMEGHTELPVCTICLERMDESVSTVLTILCNHNFHGSCLAQWEDSTCPVCRYTQTPEQVAEQVCSECQSPEDLWICLVCGYVGCGRYVDGHSHAHFMETQHCYTMELGSNRVWDYVGDNFVHRLVQTDSADGKLVEAEGNGQDLHCRKGGVDGVPVGSEEKLDSIQLEYTYLLTSQLEAQRKHYEDKIRRLEDNSHREMEEVINRARTSVEESKAMEEKLTVVNKEKSKTENKLSQVVTKLGKIQIELNEEKQMNESLRANQKEWQKKMLDLEKRLQVTTDVKDKQIADLQEQMRDLMFYLEAQSTVSKSPLADEIQEGSVEVGATPTTSKTSRGGKKKRK